ncbi:pilus assembly protein PilP [Exilibacterium tricleocarpae]|uniref:Pilus assembly protein PilP n=1 Tax=Exilibacterium tricleocarpae TaxID=2591008 RepID=A0A545T611_9GAMM|nr:type 4a pilus biogenesis protein PilO [Exilibacterium tricleocarpae]TQV72654.1 pilus assembly protein PilP [Exilibacterium tricleocarpae]
MAAADIIQQLQDFDLSEIDWDRVGIWPTPIKVIACLLASTAIIVAGYFFFVKDLNLQLESARAKEQNLRSSFETKAFEASNLESYRAQMVEMEASFGALVAQLPSDTEVPGLLEDIDEKGNESGLNILTIDLQAENVREFYVELPIKIEVEGGYHDLGAFVSGIAGMPRIVTLHDYDISQASEGNILAMNILAKTYRYKGQEE